MVLALCLPMASCACHYKSSNYVTIVCYSEPVFCKLINLFKTPPYIDDDVCFYLFVLLNYRWITCYWGKATLWFSSSNYLTTLSLLFLSSYTTSWMSKNSTRTFERYGQSSYWYYYEVVSHVYFSFLGNNGRSSCLL